MPLANGRAPGRSRGRTKDGDGGTGPAYHDLLPREGLEQGAARDLEQLRNRAAGTRAGRRLLLQARAGSTVHARGVVWLLLLLLLWRCRAPRRRPFFCESLSLLQQPGMTMVVVAVVVTEQQRVAAAPWEGSKEGRRVGAQSGAQPASVVTTYAVPPAPTCFSQSAGAKPRVVPSTSCLVTAPNTMRPCHIPPHPGPP